MRRIVRILITLLLVALIYLIFTASSILFFGRQMSIVPADAAIVLGAGVDGPYPSAVFAARIDHGIALYRQGIVRKLILTGGRGAGDVSEGEAARRYALEEGVPATDILIETVSRVTYENLAEAQRLMNENGLQTALIVSDPLHMKRAMAMSAELGIVAQSSPTPLTLYRSWRTQVPFLLRETWMFTAQRLANILGLVERMNTLFAPEVIG